MADETLLFWGMSLGEGNSLRVVANQTSFLCLECIGTLPHRFVEHSVLIIKRDSFGLLPGGANDNKRDDKDKDRSDYEQVSSSYFHDYYFSLTGQIRYEK